MWRQMGGRSGDRHQRCYDENDYDLFQSAGLFADRDIDANQLRKEAWRIPN